MKREIKTTLALDGEKAFKKGVEDAARGLRVLDSELKASSAGFAGQEKSLQSLTAKGELFEKRVKQQKEVVNALAKAVKESSEKYGDASEKTDGYRIKLNNATAALAKMERELDQNSQAIVEFGRDTDKAASKMDKLKAKSKELGDSLKSMGEKMKGIGQSMSMYVTAPIVGAGIISFKTAADMEDAIGAADQVFKGSSKEMQSWAKNLKSYYGIASGEALEYGNMMGSMLQNIGGLSEAEAAKMSGTLIELAGDLTAMFGGTTESAVQALTGALKGNNTMLDNYGMAVNDALIKTKAFEMGIYKGKGEMDLATKQAATLALIMEQSSAAQGQAAREAAGASGSMRAFKTEVKNLSAGIGEELLPVLTPMIGGLGEIIAQFGDLSPATKKTIIVVAGVAAALGPVLVGLGSLALALPLIGSGFAAVGTAAGVVGAAIGAISLPVIATVAAIGGLIAIGVALAKNWDSISAKAAELKATVSAQFAEIKAAIGENITGAVNFVKGGIDKIYGFFANLHLPEIKIPKIKMPHFSIKGNFSLNPPKVPSFGVDWYAKGGIFTQPSIIGVGEAGTEAVIPLDRLEQMLARFLQPAPSQTKEVNIEVNNYGPAGESSEGATTRALQKLQYLGVFG